MGFADIYKRRGHPTGRGGTSSARPKVVRHKAHAKPKPEKVHGRSGTTHCPHCGGSLVNGQCTHCGYHVDGLHEGYKNGMYGEYE